LALSASDHSSGVASSIVFFMVEIRLSYALGRG
jgi:hypothetical protein